MTTEHNHDGEGRELDTPADRHIDQRSAEQIKSTTAAQRADLARRQIATEQKLADARADMERQRKELEDTFAKQRSELEAIIAPLRAELQRLEEMSWTVDLYLGRHEDVTLIKDGEPAPENTPLTIRQMVLAADEESLILGEEGTFDYKDMGTFVRWLVASDANRDRIIPDARSVVVVIPTRQFRDYGNVWENAAKETLNQQAHWIIRNGERLYLMVTDDERLRIGERILPKRDEFVKFFYRRAWGGVDEPMAPGGDEWAKAERKADAYKRHYMRLMLVLQGLVDRTVVFHPLPAHGINLMSVTSQDNGSVVLMREDEGVLTDGRPPFRAWQAELNKSLRVGMRVVLGRGISDHNYDHNQGNSRISPPNASHPPTGEPLMIEGTRDGAFVVRYERTDTVWKRQWVETRPGWGYHTHVEATPEKRASARIKASDSWVLPFDLASVDDLTYYLNSRGARRDYQSMVPVIQAALRAKKAELEAEAPLRQAMLGRIAAEVGDPVQAEQELAELVTWWKIGRRRATALAGDPLLEVEASVAILTEWRKRQKVKPNTQAVQAVVKAAQSLPGALVAAYTRSKKFVVYTPAADGETAFVTEHTVSKTGTVTTVKEWITLDARVLSTMVVLWQAESWPSWDKYPDVSERLTGPEREQVVREVLAKAAAAALTPCAVIEHIASRYDYNTFTVVGVQEGVDLTDHDAYNGKESWNNLGQRMRAFLDHEAVRWSRKNGAIVIQDGGGRYLDVNKLPSLAATDEKQPAVPGGDRMIWRDQELLAKVVAAQASHEEFAGRTRSAEQAEYERVRRVVDAHTETLVEARHAQMVAMARRDFEVDFGVEASSDEALWEHHLKTLKLQPEKMPRGLADALHALVRASVPLDGKTVEQAVTIFNDTIAATDRDRLNLEGKELSPWLHLVLASATSDGDVEDD